jgi:hypothetical protein
MGLQQVDVFQAVRAQLAGRHQLITAAWAQARATATAS